MEIPLFEMFCKASRTKDKNRFVTCNYKYKVFEVYYQPQFCAAALGGTTRNLLMK